MSSVKSILSAAEARKGRASAVATEQNFKFMSIRRVVV